MTYKYKKSSWNIDTAKSTIKYRVYRSVCWYVYLRDVPELGEIGCVFYEPEVNIDLPFCSYALDEIGSFAPFFFKTIEEAADNVAWRNL